MPILNKIFPIAFGRVEKNENSYSDRGWFPPNCKLLDHAELHKCEKLPSKTDVNTTNGMGASILDAIIQQQLCTNKIKDAYNKRQDDGKKKFKNTLRKQEKLPQVFSMP